MKNWEISKELFEHYVPAFETPDEDIFRRMEHQVAIAGREITELMGDHADDYLLECPELMTNVQNYICTEAAYRAVPQLDLVLTETGFGVVSNSNVAPASKDRVAALLEDLRTHASDVYDVIVMYLLKYTSWRDSDNAKKVVNNLLYSSSQFRHQWQWRGKAIYREEFAQLRPKIELAAAYLQKIISKELYAELLVRLRTGKNEAAYELVTSRATNYMFAFLDDQPLKDFKSQLVDTVETLCDSLQEYKNSSTFRARHADAYENDKNSGVFFMS